MAVTISRKLFPVATGTTQPTTNCSGCPYDCPFDCYGIPDFYYSQPPPPPPLADHQKQLPTLIIILLLFVGFFIAFSFYIIVVKCRSWQSGSGNEGTEALQSDGGEGEFMNENQVDHPIWFITTAGLQQSVINSITVCKYKKSEGLIEGTECSVCLSEFQEDEMLRLLPKCSHAFHIGCVDTWLRTHTTCPLCRAHILTDFTASNSVRPPNLGPVNQNEANLGVNEETQMENEEINGEVLVENEGVVSRGNFENRGDVVDEQREVGIVQTDDSKVEGNESTRNNQMDSSSAT
ncbi:RING-H2 finger protein ATL54-like [Benincasa hispida]|uniref:RING-H2 finger protein ATL54-like n=1 Tax=Benincasa hispida TaxID=102211 RepID=UPI00190074C2|nr:RING-H2 finger protein ATL54-like [Benincasa hispida]